MNILEIKIVAGFINYKVRFYVKNLEIYVIAWAYSWLKWVNAPEVKNQLRKAQRTGLEGWQADWNLAW